MMVMGTSSSAIGCAATAWSGGSNTAQVSTKMCRPAATPMLVLELTALEDRPRVSREAYTGRACVVRFSGRFPDCSSAPREIAPAGAWNRRCVRSRSDGVRVSFLFLMFAFGPCAACSAPSSIAQLSTAAPTVSTLSNASRKRPPLAARNCGGLSQEELLEASDYLSHVTRFTKLYPEDATDSIQQRDISGDPGRVVGVILFIPAERGLNRAYLERLLYCHAVKPPALGEHPNDPLLASGIVSVDVTESPGGEYQIKIVAESRAETEQLLQRTQALGRQTGSVQVHQLDLEAPE